mmetsp:Transcript_26168/g.65052  ORF Transcript_26168/g.65052 Transcript_26168/m.65052 type:complete len:156 (-) Transcript_26168:722-1189(-)
MSLAHLCCSFVVTDCGVWCVRVLLMHPDGRTIAVDHACLAAPPRPSAFSAASGRLAGRVCVACPFSPARHCFIAIIGPHFSHSNHFRACLLEWMDGWMHGVTSAPPHPTPHQANVPTRSQWHVFHPPTHQPASPYLLYGVCIDVCQVAAHMCPCV